MLAKEYTKKLIHHLSSISRDPGGHFTIDFINSDFSLPIIFKTLLDKYFNEGLIDKSRHKRMVEYYENGVSEEVCESIANFLANYDKSKDTRYLFDNAKKILGEDLFHKHSDIKTEESNVVLSKKNIKRGGNSRRKKSNQRNKTNKRRRNKLCKGGSELNGDNSSMVDETDVCPICLDSYTPENPKWVLHYSSTPSNNDIPHSFHYQCVNQYYSIIASNHVENLDNILTCPICREIVRGRVDPARPIIRGRRRANDQMSRFRYIITDSIEYVVSSATGVRLNNLNENQRQGVKRFLLLYYFLLLLLFSWNDFSRLE